MGLRSRPRRRARACSPPPRRTPSLPTVTSGPRPGPDILYAPPADGAAARRTPASGGDADPGLGRDAPTATASSSTRTSSTTTTARAARATPATRARATTRSRAPNGTYTYPTDAALRAATPPTSSSCACGRSTDATAFRITLNTLLDPDAGRRRRSRSATRAAPLPMPARRERVRARPQLFLTVHGATAELRDAADAARRSRPRRRRRSTASAARSRCACRTPPGTRARRRCGSPPASACGTRRPARYLLPRQAADARRARAARGDPTPRRRSSTSPSATSEPLPDVANPASLGRPARGGATSGRATALRDRRHRRRSAPRSTSRKLARRARRDDGRRAADRPDEPHPRQPLRARAGRRLRRASAAAATSCEGELLGRLQPYAIYVPQQAGARRRLRPDAAAALARRELQPVHRLAATSRSSASAAPGSIVITPAGRGPGRLVLRPRRRRHVRGVGRRRAPLPARPGVDRRSPATRWAATAPTSSRPSSPTCSRAPADRRAAGARHLDDRPTTRPAARDEHRLRCSPSLRHIPFLMWVGADRRARADHRHDGARAALRRRSATATCSTSSRPPTTSRWRSTTSTRRRPSSSATRASTATRRT